MITTIALIAWTTICVGIGFLAGQHHAMRLMHISNMPSITGPREGEK